MSIVLDAILAQAADQYPATVALSPESVTVLLYASGFLEQRRNWLDEQADPLDEVTDADWDIIEKLVANVYQEINTPMLGLIFPIMTATVPDNCLLCDGGEYAKADFPLLYDILDDAFIVDADTFKVPDLRSRAIVGATETGSLTHYAVNEEGGADEITLSSAEMPSHSHGLFQTDGLALAPGELPVLVPFVVALGSTDSAGGNTPHENRQPFTALNYVVIAL